MVLLAEHEGIEGQVFVVTGGLTSVGVALCLELLQRGADEVRCFDTRSSSPHAALLKRNRVVCITGEMKKRDQLDKAIVGASCVFHLPSHGISGKEMLQAGKIDEINLTGTINVIESCVKCGVERLLFMSSYNAVFGGKEIINGNESMDYFPTESHLDSHGRCKALAEQLVLKNNGRPLKAKNGRLKTCAIRPAAVYGPGEEYHVPRFLNLAQKGMFYYIVGNSDVKTDWVYVDNLVQAFLLASMGLIEDIPGRKGAPAAGQVYFISDGIPVNSFSFMEPLLKSLGYQLPDRRISTQTAMKIAWVFWGLYGLMYPWLDKHWLPDPPILPSEVHKVGVTHYFSILKARQELGYIPYVDPKQGMQRTVEFWREKQLKDFIMPELHYWIGCVGGMILLFGCAFIPPPYLGVFEWARVLASFLFRTQRMMQLAFLAAFIAHLFEGIYAWRLARRVDPVNAKSWFLQTTLLGFPSLRLLLRRSKKNAE